MSEASKVVFLFNWILRTDGDVVVDCFIFEKSTKLESSKPERRTKIWFTHDKKFLRPFRFEVFQGNRSSYKSEKLATKLLKHARLIIISPDDQPPNIKEFLEYTKSFGLPNPKLVKICPICLKDRQRVTIIKSGQEYQFFGKIVCKSCAQREIRDDYNRRGIEITQSTRNFYTKQLENTRSVDKSVSILEEDSPVRDESAINTLYDVIGADKSFQAISLKDFLQAEHKISSKLMKAWYDEGVKTLLPVQQIAINKGLLNYKDLLVIAGTSSGKTFVGELAGIHNLRYRKSKFVFLTPLVALTNQKYELFRKRYTPFGYRVGVRVGMSKIEVEGEDKAIVDSNFRSSDIIVGTYEAFDWIIRSGQISKAGDIGVLVIDEVQLLGDEQRGQQLDGMLARIRFLFPNCQIICLSATIGNPKELAKELRLSLVEYNARPIPLERHLVITEKLEEKERRIAKLIKDDGKRKSSTGYYGKSLVFTNSRKRAQQLAAILRSELLKSTYYHAGMTFTDRKKVEKGFEKGKYDVVTTTAALGAGVDFPVSQVIFETPGMGARWLKTSEFHQMIGRAGRFGFHDLGRTYLFVTPGSKIYTAMDFSEEQIGFKLLTEPVEDIDLEIDFDTEADQIMALISANSPKTKLSLEDFYESLYYSTGQLEDIISTLQKLKMIIHKSGKYHITALGRASSESFLTPLIGYRIATETLKKSVLDVAVELTPFKSIHLSQSAHAEIEQLTKAKMSTRFLSDGILEVIFGTSDKGVWSRSLAQKVKVWTSTFFTCACKEYPYCSHAMYKISKTIVNLRLEGLTPKQIVIFIGKKYHLFAYAGDLYSWLYQLSHSLEAIKRLGLAMKKGKISQDSSKLAKSISKGRSKYKQSVKKKRSTKNVKKK